MGVVRMALRAIVRVEQWVLGALTGMLLVCWAVMGLRWLYYRLRRS